MENLKSNIGKGLLLASVLVAAPIQANDLYQGPIGDLWNEISVLKIPSNGIKLTKDTVLNVDRLILNGDLETRGYRLKVNAREVIFNNNAKIIGFHEEAPKQTNIPASYVSSAKNGTHSSSNHSAGGHASNGKSGLSGFDGIDGRQDSKEVNIFALDYIGNISINGNGEQGGKGGIGGRGQDGGAGGHGKDAWADASCWNDGDGRNGTNGGNGGYPGAPGIGGPGGIGGNNIPVKLYSALAINPANTSITSASGLPGEAGDVGIWGNAGAAGTGGSKARDEVSCGPWFQIWKSVTHRAGGSNGSVLDYSTTHKETISKQNAGRIGANTSVENIVPQKLYFQNLRKRQLEVYNQAYNFHFSRLFQFLVQDGIRLATQSQFNRSLLGQVDTDIMQTLLESEEILIDQIIYSWQAYFIDRIQENENISFEQQEYLEFANDFMAMLKDLKNPLSRPDQLITSWNQRLSGISDKTSLNLLNLNQSCTLFLKEKKLAFSGELPFTDFFYIPACTVQSMRNLVKAPASKIQLVAQRSGNFIFPTDALALKVEILENKLSENERHPQATNPFNIVIVNNSRFNFSDFVDSKDINNGEMKETALIDSLNSFEEQKVNLQNYKKYIQVLLNGMR